MEAFLDAKPHIHKNLFNMLFDDLIKSNELNKEFDSGIGEITILQYGCYENFINDDFLVKFVENGGDLNQTRLYPGISPLVILFANKKYDMAKKLISYGATVTQNDLKQYIKHALLNKLDKDFFDILINNLSEMKFSTTEKKRPYIYDKIDPSNYIKIIINSLTYNSHTHHENSYNDFMYIYNKLNDKNLITDIPCVDTKLIEKLKEIHPKVEEFLRDNKLYSLPKKSFFKLF